MKYIVFDLELNQPSKKLIEIGAVLLHINTGEFIDEFSALINPDEKLNPDIIKLTSITDYMLESAPDVSKAMGDFFTWIDASNCGRRLVAWGNDLAYLPEPKGKSFKYVDLKHVSELFRIPLKGKARGGLKNTLDAFNLRFDGNQHRALEDAKNTAKLMHYFYKRIELVEHWMQDMQNYNQNFYGK